MVEGRDKRFGFNPADARHDRQDLVTLAKPQGGVDAMAAILPRCEASAGRDR